MEKQMQHPGFHQTLNREQLLTVGDFIELKNELLREVRQIVNEARGLPAKPWLKSAEVRKLLGVSPGTLQTLRNNGTIPFTRIGGVIYYNTDEIVKMMERYKSPALSANYRSWEK